MTRRRRNKLACVSQAALPLVLLSACHAVMNEPVARSLTEFEARLDHLRTDARIPGLAAAITDANGVAWSKGFGVVDVGTGSPTTDTTAFHLASLTKPFAATLLLQMVEHGQLSLDAPVSDFGIALQSSGTIRVRHLLSHTSSGTPGTVFAYDGNRFGLLDSVVARVSGKSFAALLEERIVTPLHLDHTAPNPLTPSFTVSGFDRATYEKNLAHGYTTTSGSPVSTAYPDYFGTAAGLTASVLDVARFSMAWDNGSLLSPATRTMAWTPVVLSGGATSPYGLGWFVTNYRGEKIVWHYGLWTAISSLIVKVPDRGLTFIVLANSDGLSSSYPLGAGKLDTSPWARAFLDAFVFGGAVLRR